MLIILTLFIALFFANSATATAAEDYGPWFPDPNQSSGIYAQFEPFNDQNIAEQTTFACVDENGSVISAKTSEYLSSIYLAASDVYQGNFEFTGTLQVENNDQLQAPPVNGGYPSGTAGMQAFLRGERALLETGRWIPYDQRGMIKSNSVSSKPNYPSNKQGWLIELTTKSSLTSKQSSEINGLINSSATNPLQLTSNLPEACALSPITPVEPTITDAFSSPGKFATNILLYVPADLASSTFDFLQPFAFKYTFFTPHTERGDLMWEIPDSCSPTSTANSALSKNKITETCAGGQPLGFSSSPDTSGDRAWFLNTAIFLQWLISGTYFLTLFTAATLYIFRGSRRNSLNVIKLAPRLVLSIVLTIFAAFLIGALISVSNVLVKIIFDFNSVEAVGSVNTFLLQAGNIVGGPEIFQRFIALVVGGLTAFFYLSFVLVSLARQVILVALVVLAPLAAFSLLSERWTHYFKIYIRLLLIVVLLPVVLAFILKTGMSINPLVSSPAESYGNIEGALGLLLMLITFALMYKAITISKDLALYGSFNLSLQPAMLGGGNSSPALETGPVEIGSSPAAFIPASRQSDLQHHSMDSKPAQLVNPDKNLGSGDSGNLVGGGGMPAPQGQIESFQAKRKTYGKRISNAAAKKYKTGLRNAKAAATVQKGDGKRLTPAEVQKIEAAYARRHGGVLKEQGGNFFLEPYEPKRFEGEE
jgi:hypothetical protein